MREFNVLDKFLYNKYILHCENELKENPKSFWNYVRSKRVLVIFPPVLNIMEFPQIT